MAFAERLNLSPTKARQLNKARTVLQTKIKKYFSEKTNTTTPLFYIQGSVKHGTVIRKQDDTCDIDVGVYFKGKPRIKPATIQANIVKAIGNHTNEKASIRQKCVRVYYANLFHIDLPVYYIDIKTGTIYLGIGKEWHPSDPKQFTDWLKTEVIGTQQQRLVMYFKAWADVVKGRNQQKMPNGLSFTLWVNTFYCEDKRDDISFIKTAYKLLKYLKRTETDEWDCAMPVVPKDNVIQKLSWDQRKNFKYALDELIQSSVKIFESNSKEQCIEAWKWLLGKWFN
ncbi:MAG: hypothetical protein BGO69_17000 [Bacteroidetes bacterium 46-16]|nr:MAG: hypothetical protein BGO69_17000 [Bacteroidetes bacterium 46-16]